MSVRVGFEGEAGGALGAEVARRRRLGHCRAVERLVEVKWLGLWLVMELGRLTVWTLHARPIQGQGHQWQGVAVLVFPEMLQAAEQPFAQGAGKTLWGPGTGLWQQSFPWPNLFAQYPLPFSPSASHGHWRRHSQATSTVLLAHLIPLDRRLVTFQGRDSEKGSESESETKRQATKRTLFLGYLEMTTFKAWIIPASYSLMTSLSISPSCKHKTSCYVTRSYTLLYGMLSGHAGGRQVGQAVNTNFFCFFPTREKHRETNTWKQKSKKKKRINRSEWFKRYRLASEHTQTHKKSCK